jgi:hypothetical protein
MFEVQADISSSLAMTEIAGTVMHPVMFWVVIVTRFDL